MLGNTSTRPNESALETVFGKFGPLESVKVFPGKTYALISFKEVAPAAEAMQCLDGHSLLSVSGMSGCDSTCHLLVFLHNTEYCC